jgi:peptidoglycan/xylan/chitin deacetylase (PgdA/CDA1 family)
VSRRRIAVSLVVAAALGGAGAAVYVRTASAHRRPAVHVAVDPDALDMRDLPVPVPIPHRHVFSGPHLQTPVPVLMYHAIGNPPAGAPYPELFVSAPGFRAQMRALARARYHPITLGHLWAAWQGRAPLPSRPVVLTFDDGYRGDYYQAMPALHRRGWPAVLNLLVANLHRKGWGLKTWMVRRMVAAGWEVDSHTLTHPDLTTVSNAQLWREVHTSRVVLQHLFHVPVDFFCYPAGAFDPQVEAAVRRAGYLAAMSELPGRADPEQGQALHRIRVDGGETPAQLLGSLTSAE